ncbi:MAG: hypothetical protein IT379_40480, partial [Deltaproteobacteria bacterium]|nr:hypothetical protein [Deltaproteobacteria bacterium]
MSRWAPLLSACLWVGCESASLQMRDVGTGPADAGTGADATAEDAATTVDAGPDTSVALGGPMAPVSPSTPEPPMGATGASVAFLAGTSPTDLAAAQPGLLPPAITAVTCPAGWVVGAPDVDPDVPAPCEPWPSEGPTPCAAGEAHFPGRSGCEPLGSACPTAGSWATDLPASGATIVYVRPGATGGTGTSGAPFGTLAEALAAASDGDVVALAAGTYPRATLTRAVTLWGACARDVVVETSTASTAAIEALAPGVVLRNLALRGGQAALRITEPGSVEVHGIEVGGAENAVLVDGGTLRGDRLLAHETLGAISGQRNAILARRGATMPSTVELTDVVAQDLSSRGVTADGSGTVVTLARASVARSAADGLYVSNGGNLAVTNAVVEHAAHMAIGCTGTGSTVAVDGSLLRDVDARAGGDGGYGLLVLNGCSATVTRTFVVRARQTGVVLGDGATRLSVDGLVVTDTQPRARDGIAWGIELRAGSASLGRVVVARASDRGITVSTSDAVDLADVVVHDVAPSPTGGGTGIRLEAGDPTLERVRIMRATGIGLWLRQATQLTGTDLRVGATEPGDEPGFGIVAEGGAHATLVRVVLGANREAGAIVRVDPEGSVGGLDLQAVVVRPMSSATLDVPALVSTGGSIVAQDLVVAGSTGSAIIARGAGASVSATRAVIGETRSRGDFSGYALLVTDGAEARLDEATLVRNGTEVVRVRDEGSSLSATNLIVATDGAMPSARGIVVSGAAADLARVRLDGPFALALDVQDRATCTADDLQVRGAEVAVQARDGATLTVRRALVESATVLGLRADGVGTQLTVDDLRVGPADAPLGGGIGALATGGATLSATRVIIDGMRDVGAASADRGSSMVLRDALVGATRRSTEPAVGLAALGGDLDARDFVVADGEGTGVHLDDGSGRVLLAAGEIRGNDVGVASELDIALL